MKMNLIANVSIAVAIAVCGCTNNRGPDASASTTVSTLTVEVIESASCKVVTTAEVSRAVGFQVTSSQLGSVTCSYGSEPAGSPSVLVSIAPGRVSLGNPIEAERAPRPIHVANQTAEWRRSALPSGIRIGMFTNGWTLTIDVSTDVKNADVAATTIAEAAATHLPKR